MMVERLTAYHSSMKRLPDGILSYRDGVSESQYGMVFKDERPQIEEGCRIAGKTLENSDGWLPKITLIVVGKRHHTRFFTVSDPPASQTKVKGKNLRAGLVVDSCVVHPKQFSFYLQSHHSPEGTAHSGHYVVIHDTARYTPKDLQEIVSIGLTTSLT